MNKFILILFAGGLLYSCKKEQPELRSLEEDCGCAKEVSAGFVMEEMTTSNPNFVKYTDTDSIFEDKDVRFYALEDNAEYTWYIGAEVLHTREVIRYFPTTMAGQTVPITLVTKKKPNAICLPNDDGYDSIIKQLTVVDYNFDNFFNNPNVLEGTYRMKDPTMSDSIDILVELKGPIADGVGERICFTNFDGNDNMIYASNFDGKNYRQLWMSEFGNCYSNGFFHRKLNGEVVLELPANNGSTCITYHYIGRKLN